MPFEFEAPLEARPGAHFGANARAYPQAIAPPQHSCPALRELVEALAAACDQPPTHMARQVKAALGAATANPALLSQAQRTGSADAYQRHVLAADAHGRFTIVSLVWWPGQASPVHAHHTWCGYAVVEGIMTETLYDWQGAALGATVASTHPRAPGTRSFTGAGRGGIHRLGNAGATPAISLHVYGVAPEHVATHVNDRLNVVTHPSSLEKAVN